MVAVLGEVALAAQVQATISRQTGGLRPFGSARAVVEHPGVALWEAASGAFTDRS